MGENVTLLGFPGDEINKMQGGERRGEDDLIQEFWEFLRCRKRGIFGDSVNHIGVKKVTIRLFV